MNNETLVENKNTNEYEWVNYFTEFKINHFKKSIINHLGELKEIDSIQIKRILEDENIKHSAKRFNRKSNDLRVIPDFENIICKILEGVNKLFPSFDSVEFLKFYYQEIEQLEKIQKEKFKEKANDDKSNFNENNNNYNQLDVLTLLATRQRNEATELLVEQIKKDNHFLSIRDDNNSQILIYQNGIYTNNGESFIKEEVRNILGKAFTTSLCKDVIAKISADSYIDQEKLTKEPDLNLIAVNNGIYDLSTNELKPFNPSLIFLSKIQVDFNPQAKCPNILKFLSSVVEHESDIDILQELIGYLLFRDYKIQKAIMLIGGGRNGKGALLRLLKHFISENSCAEIALESIEKDPYASGELYKKLANLCGDLSKTALRTTGNFKKLTGQDLISAPRKYLNRVNFVNYAKMVFSCNELPYPGDMSEAFFNRWIILTFPNTFLPKNEIDLIPESERINIKPRDQSIEDRIKTPEELSGLLNWALIGLRRLLRNKSFSCSPTTDKIKKTWLRKSNSFLAFCQDYLVFDYDSEIIKSELRKTYGNYCREHKIRSTSDREIKTILMEHYGVGERKSGNDYLWLGVSIKNIKENGQLGYVGHPFSKTPKSGNLAIGAKPLSNLSNLSNFEVEHEDIK